jgi:hypothetical protein
MSNLEDNLSFVGRNRRAFKEAHARLCEAVGYTHVLTLAWNRDTRPAAARSDLRELHRRVDETLLGRRFYKVPSEDRSLAMFAFEKIDFNLHVHALWRVPEGRPGANRLMRFHKMFPDERGGVWNQIVTSGTYKLRIIKDHAEAAGYVMKEQHMDADDQTIVWSSDFMHVK